MKKFLPGFLLMATGNLLLSFIIAWWAPVPWIIFIAFYFKMGAMTGSVAGGLSLSLVWMGMAFISSLKDHADILGKTALILGELDVAWLYFFTFLISFITGALSGWLGGAFEIFFRKAFRKNESNAFLN